MCSIEGLLLLLIDDYDCDLFLLLLLLLTDVRRLHEHDVHRDDDEQ